MATNHETARGRIEGAERVVVLTGAGISRFERPNMAVNRSRREPVSLCKGGAAARRLPPRYAQDLAVGASLRQCSRIAWG